MRLGYLSRLLCGLGLFCVFSTGGLYDIFSLLFKASGGLVRLPVSGRNVEREWTESGGRVEEPRIILGKALNHP